MVVRHVQNGDPLSIDAKVYNTAVDLYQSRQRGPRGEFTRFQADATCAIVRNASNLAFPQFGVVGISNSEISPDTHLESYLESFVLTGLIAASATYPTMEFRWGIAQEPIPVGEYGTVRFSGLTHCFINLPDGFDVNFVKPTPAGDLLNLVKADCGARVLYRRAGTGSQRGIVIL